MKPEPPTTRTFSTFMPASGQLFGFERLPSLAGRNGSEARLERRELAVQHCRVEHRVGHHLLHIVPRLAVRDGFDVDRGFQRAVVAPAARARRPRVVGRRSENGVAKLLEHHLQVARTEAYIGLDLRYVARPEALEPDARGNETGRARHDLHEPCGARTRAGAGDETAFLAHEAQHPGFVELL